MSEEEDYPKSQLTNFISQLSSNPQKNNHYNRDQKIVSSQFQFSENKNYYPSIYRQGNGGNYNQFGNDQRFDNNQNGYSNPKSMFSDIKIEDKKFDNYISCANGSNT